MFSSNTGLFGNSSGTWDTGCARKYLKISEEDLKILDNIPGWSTKKQLSKKSIYHQEKGPQAVKRQPKPQLINPETAASTSAQNTHSTEELIENPSFSGQKNISNPASSEKEFFHSISLHKNSEKEDSLSAKVNSSASNIDKEIPSVSEDPSKMSSHPSKSAEVPVGKALLDTTYVVPSVLEDKTNDIQVIAIVPTDKNSSPQKASLKKRTFERIGSPHKPATESGSLGGLSEPVTHEKILAKKLRLLEKRFSPSKDFSLTSSQEAILAKVNLKTIENEVMSCAKTIGVSDNQVIDNAHEVNEAHLSGNTSDNLNLVENITKDKAELSKKPGSVFEEESFVSLPVPCGQALPSDQPGTTAFEFPVAKTADVPAEKHIQVEEPGASLLKGSKVVRKRKLRSKGEGSSRKQCNAKTVVAIQYTNEQMLSIIELIKLCN